MSLRIGILIDDFVLSNWQAEIIDLILKDENLSLSLVIWNKSNKKSNPKSSIGYRALMKLDRLIFKLPNSAFLKRDRTETLKKCDTLIIENLKGKFYSFLEQEDVTKIKEYELDVMIRFGFGILNGEILSAAKYGVWSLHHGDSAVNRGGPPAFWEVVNHDLVTGVTLQRLTPDLDGGEVIGKSFLKTDLTSFTRNLDAALWSGVQLFIEKLKELSKGTLRIEDNSCLGFYSKPLYKNPSNVTSIDIFIRFWFRRSREFYQNIIQPQQWSLAYKMNSHRGLEQAIFRYKVLKPPKNYDWADPFVIEKENNFYLFFEELNKKEGKAHISCMQFDDYGKPIAQSKSVVIKENYHLSYPFTFFWQGSYYMLPEAAESKNLYLYEATDFPRQWNKKQLIIQEELFDATLLQHEGVWYLFAIKKYHPSKSTDQYLNIYYSDNLLSENWIEHSQNPVKRTVIGSRPAGKIFKYKDKLIRPAQIGAPKYGYGVNFYEILILSKTEFSEVLVDKIEPAFEDGILACHTFNSKKGFNVIDIQRRK